MDKRPFLVIAICFILGIVLARFLPDWIGFFHVFIATSVFVMISVIVGADLCIRPIKPDGPAHRPAPTLCQRIANIFLLLSVTSFASLLYLNSNIFPNRHISHFLGNDRLKTTIVGVIKSLALTRRAYFGKIGSTYLFEIEGIAIVNSEQFTVNSRKVKKGEWYKVNGLAQIRIQTEEDYTYGDRLLVRGTVKRPRNVGADLRVRPNNTNGPTHRSAPTVFNYREYLERQNIFALINTNENNVTVLSQDYKSNPILKYIYSIRERLKHQILEDMPLDSGAFLRAILLGDRSELPKHIQTSFKNSGTMHISPIQNTKKLSYSSKSNLTL